MRVRSQESKRGKLGLLLICLSLVFILAGFRKDDDREITNAAAASNLASGAAGLQHSLELLTQAGLEVTEAGTPLRLVLKWQGTYGGDAEESVKEASLLSGQLGIDEAQPADEEGHATLRASGTRGAYTKVSMFWSGLEQGGSYVIVTLETSDLMNTTMFAAEAEQAGQLLQAAGISPVWNVSLQGEASLNEAPQEALSRIERIIARQFTGLKAEEHYEDETTGSLSYSVPGIERTVSSGDHRIALQTAVHKNGNNNRNRVTLGMPLITIEY